VAFLAFAGWMGGIGRDQDNNPLRMAEFHSYGFAACAIPVIAAILMRNRDLSLKTGWNCRCAGNLASYPAYL
jgi:hypothetical protein